MAVLTDPFTPANFPDLFTWMWLAGILIAIGAMQTLRGAGVRVPEDVAIAGVDDTPFARVAEPALTTVAQPVGQIGDEAVRMLLTRKREPHLAPRRLILAGQLVARDSTPSPPRNET